MKKEKVMIVGLEEEGIYKGELKYDADNLESYNYVELTAGTSKKQRRFLAGATAQTHDSLVAAVEAINEKLSTKGLKVEYVR